MMPCPRCKDSGRPGFIRSAGNRIYRECTSCEGKGYFTEDDATMDAEDKEIAKLRKRVAELEAEVATYARRHAKACNIAISAGPYWRQKVLRVLDPEDKHIWTSVETTVPSFDRHLQDPVATGESGENRPVEGRLVPSPGTTALTWSAAAPEITRNEVEVLWHHSWCAWHAIGKCNCGGPYVMKRRAA